MQDHLPEKNMRTGRMFPSMPQVKERMIQIQQLLTPEALRILEDKSKKFVTLWNIHRLLLQAGVIEGGLKFIVQKYGSKHGALEELASFLRHNFYAVDQIMTRELQMIVAEIESVKKQSTIKLDGWESWAPRTQSQNTSYILLELFVFAILWGNAQPGVLFTQLIAEQTRKSQKCLEPPITPLEKQRPLGQHDTAQLSKSQNLAHIKRSPLNEQGTGASPALTAPGFTTGRETESDALTARRIRTQQKIKAITFETETQDEGSELFDGLGLK